jgi:hypothetical protein
LDLDLKQSNRKAGRKGEEMEKSRSSLTTPLIIFLLLTITLGAIGTY